MQRKSRKTDVAWRMAAAVSAFGLSFSGCADAKLQGHVFISAVQSSNGVVDALAVDFVATEGDLTHNDVRLTVTATVPLVFEPVPGSPNCVQLPQSGRLELLEGSGQIGPDARVSITAHRYTCDGEPLDNAVWPTTSASPRTADSGAVDGGAGESGTPTDATATDSSPSLADSAAAPDSIGTGGDSGGSIGDAGGG